MKTLMWKSCFVFLAVVVTASAQIRIEAKQGSNTFLLEVHNRSGIAYPNLKVRFAQDHPSWLTPHGEAAGKVVEYRGESNVRRNKAQINLPFDLAWNGLTDVPVKLEVLSDNTVIGQFDVLFDAPDRSRISSSQMGSEEIAEDVERIAITQDNDIPKDFSLRQNFPNPFNPTTIIQFGLPVSSHVMLKVFDLLGREVKTLVDGERGAGFHQVRWDGMDVLNKATPAGVYLYRLVAGRYVQTQKMILVR